MLEYPHIHSRTMFNLDERYQSYLTGDKKLRIDGVEEKVKGYGYTDNGKAVSYTHLPLPTTPYV